ncbi:ferredoxin--NADP reductase [Saccharopolyspora gloriosae]|uniref:ferredoxin--NADP reductase n=1 Tax=Saccharopolyspora gloriosae TaxID=455344 RepID=UPI001FB5B28D|nr:ferredoxin--NADP reductase [Saccharopolyspora gloriosae]
MSQPSDSGVHRLKVDEVVQESPDAISLVFAVPDDGEFSYRPGQFLTLRVPGAHGGSVARCYSLSSSPHTDSAPRVTIKRVRGGHGSNWLCDNMTAGSIVDVLPPDGGFTPKSLDGKFLLLAGGSGITPIMSIVRSVLAGGDGRIVLIYANRDEQSVIFAGALRELAAAHPGRLTVVHWLETVQGLPDGASLRALAEPFADHEAFVCGPGAFMDVAAGALAPLGFAGSRLHIERFLSLAENPFERTEQPPAEADGEGDATVEVDIDGARHRLDWPRRQRLLDLLLERGIDAPYSCRQGACSACACRIGGGEVSMVRNDILEQEDLDDGIVLACQSLPVTDEVHVSYE